HTGTTWLHWVLKSRVCLPRPMKETHFFDFNYARGLAWYAARFNHWTGDRPIGEICSYFPSSKATARIAQHIPNCKIICSLRDPVERTYSTYKHAVYSAQTRGSFEEAIQQFPFLTRENRYGFHLNRWYEKFGKERVLVMLFDDLRDHPQALINKVTDFIEVRPIDLAPLTMPAKAMNSHPLAPRIPALARRARRAMNFLNDRKLGWVTASLDRAGFWSLFFSGKFPPMKCETEQRLRERFQPEIEALEKLIGRELPSWKGPHRDVTRAAR
ncbi:MAG: sulfotransferase family protein, partial [Candidatus Binataceae bacterium]